MSLMTLKELAERTGLDRGSAYKAILKEGIPMKLVPMPTGRGIQDVTTVTRSAGERLVAKINARREAARKNAQAAASKN